MEHPTAHSTRKPFEQEVAGLSKLWSAYQKQHKAAVDARVLLAETGDKVKEQKMRVQQASVEAALETSSEAGAWHAGCGEDVATLTSLFAAAQHCYLPPNSRNQNLESFLVALGQLRSCFQGPQVPATPRAQASQTAASLNAVPAPFPNTLPGFPGPAVGRVDAGTSESPLNQKGQLQWQKGRRGEQAQVWPQCVQIGSHQQPQQQLCTQDILDFPNAKSRVTGHRAFLCLLSSSRHA